MRRNYILYKYVGFQDTYGNINPTFSLNCSGKIEVNNYKSLGDKKNCQENQTITARNDTMI